MLKQMKKGLATLGQAFAVSESQLESEREKLHFLALNLGLSHPLVLRQSRFLDRIITAKIVRETKKCTRERQWEHGHE